MGRLNFDNILKTREVTTSLSLSLSLSIYIYIYSNQIHYERDHLWALLAARATESATLFLVPIVKILKRHTIKIDPFMKFLISMAIKKIQSYIYETSYIDGNK